MVSSSAIAVAALLLATFGVEATSHVNSREDIQLEARFANGTLGSSCHTLVDCLGVSIYGGVPACTKGKCSFDCLSLFGFKMGSDKTGCTKSCTDKSQCAKGYLAPPHSQHICNDAHHCDIACDPGYAKGPLGELCVPCHWVGKCTTPTSTSTTTSATPTPTPPTCTTSTFTLVGASEFGFNQKAAPFSIQQSCGSLDTSNYTVLANGNPINTTLSGSLINVPGINDDSSLISVYALDKTGMPVFGGFSMLFGSINRTILVLDVDGKPAPGVDVRVNATIFPGVGQIVTTDSSGKAQLTNLIATTLSLVATTNNNELAVAGVSSTNSGDITLQLTAFGANTTTGTAGKVKRDSFTVSTAGSPSLQQVSKLYTPQKFTKTAYINYIFQTAEVPGGFFGSQFNDYFSITIRTDDGKSTFYTNSMNALGLAAFDSSGATSNYSLTLDVTNSSKVEFDVAVSNVGDALYDSQVIVNDYGDLTCDQCTDSCSDCPGDPMCQDSCKNPPPKTCSFYRNCAEAKKKCGPGGYPLGYGEHFCNKFTANIGSFTSKGQAWVYNVMSCLQHALIPAVTCATTCDALATAAFDSHPACYVNSGLCDLTLKDWAEIAVIVGFDGQTYKALQASFKQAVSAGGACGASLLSEFEQEIEALENEVGQLGQQAVDSLTNAYKITKQWLQNAL